MFKELVLGNLSLKVMDDNDLGTLFQWRNSVLFLKNLTSRPPLNTYEELVREVSYDFSNDTHLQLMIKLNGEYVGTIYSYRLDDHNHYCFISIYIHPIKGKRLTGIGAKSVLIFSHYLFKELKMFKIYFDVYSFNYSVKRQLNKRASLEGVFKKQTLKNGQRHDLLRYAIYKETLSPYQFLNRVELIN